MFAGTSVLTDRLPSPTSFDSVLESSSQSSVSKIQKKQNVNKSIISNERRLQAENAKWLIQKTNHAAVQNALKKIDSGGLGLNKKVIFPEDSDDDQDKDNSHNENTATNHVRSSNQLFDEDSDDNTVEPSFHIREQFEGEEGEKLFALQTKFSNNDVRFRVDKRFLEDDNMYSAEEEVERGFEKDPEAPVQVQQARDSAAKKEQDKYYFAVSQNLSNLFSSSSEKPKFSLSHTDTIDNFGQNQTTKEDAHLSDHRPVRKFRERHPEVERETQVPSNPFKPSGWFFIKPDDENLAEGCSFFSRHESEEVIKEKWATARPIVLEIFKKLRKGKGREKQKRTMDKFKIN